MIPKPSRAYYPCMQTAAPMMSAFVTYLLSFTVTWWSGRKFYNAVRQRKIAVSIFSFICLCLFGIMTLVENSTDLLAQIVLPVTEPRMAWGRNNPVGIPRGIYPGRVTWAHAPGAAAWEKGTGFWYEDRWNNQEDADWLINQSLLMLTGEKKRRLHGMPYLFPLINIIKKGRKVIRKAKRLPLKSTRIIPFPMRIVNN